MQTAMEHSAQVILYTLLMTERYNLPISFKVFICDPGFCSFSINPLWFYIVLFRYLNEDIDLGLLYYLHTDQTLVIL